MRFYKTKFEDFNPNTIYDLILESESACYIKIKEGFSVANKTLRDGGYILAADYFVYNSNSKSPHLKSSHSMDEYLDAADSAGCKLLREYDQTENTMLTLDYGKHLMDRFISPTIDYVVYSTKKNYPKTASIIGKLIKPKFQSKKDQLDLLDSALFRKYRRYMIFLFKKI